MPSTSVRGPFDSYEQAKAFLAANTTLTVISGFEYKGQLFLITVP